MLLEATTDSGASYDPLDPATVDGIQLTRKVRQWEHLQAAAGSNKQVLEVSLSA